MVSSVTRTLRLVLTGVLLMGAACGEEDSRGDQPTPSDGTGDTTGGDGDADTTGDGDGDGDTTGGDGDTTGDGDGDTTGDGDGDPEPEPEVPMEFVYTATPDEPFDDETVVSTIDIKDAGFVVGLELDVDIDHSRVAELDIYLQHLESSLVLDLVTRPSSTAANVKLALSDEAVADIQDDVLPNGDDAGEAYDQDAYQPLTPLRFAYGETLAGQWRLVVSDGSRGDGGRFNSWTMRVQVVQGAPAPAIAIARPRPFRRQRPAGGIGMRDRSGIGIAADVPIRYRLMAGATGDIDIAATGPGVTSKFFAIDDDNLLIRTGYVAFKGSAASLGDQQVEFVGTLGDLTDRRTRATEFVEPAARGVSILSNVTLAELGYPDVIGNDMWGWTDPETGKEWAIMGTQFGTAFVDVSDPRNPRVAATMDTQTSQSYWRDMKVYKNHAFIVSEANGHGLQVFDLTELRGFDGDTPVPVEPDAHFDEFGNAHNIDVDEESGYAIIVGADNGSFPNLCSGGLFMVDISEPLLPTYAGCFSGGTPAVTQPGQSYPRNVQTHDLQCVTYDGPDTRFTGREICLSCDYSAGLGIADITNKDAVEQLSRINYRSTRTSHQGWLSEDHRYFFLNDESDERIFGSTRTVVFDLENLENPIELGDFLNPSNAIGHDAYVMDDRLYMANYTSGLRVVDLNQNPDTGIITVEGMVETAYFDAYVSDDTADGRGAGFFDGAWSVYPFFDSGTILVSDINAGLLILEAN